MANKNGTEKEGSQYRHTEETAQTDATKTGKDDQDEKKQRRDKPGRIRLIPIWLRLVLILLFAALALIVGAMIGYAVVGDGTNPFEIFQPDTWYHIHDIIFEGTEYERD